MNKRELLKLIGKGEYRDLCNVVRDTAHRDLKDLLKKRIILQRGHGAQVYYILRASEKSDGKSDGNTQKTHKNP